MYIAWNKDYKNWFKVLEYLDFEIKWDKVEIYETLEHYASDIYSKKELQEFIDKLDNIKSRLD